MSLDIILKIDGVEIFTTNITHNLNKMALECGLYYAMWRPEEINCYQAKDVERMLVIGLSKLIKDPEYYKMFNPTNGWGTYDSFVKSVEKYLKACVNNPNAFIEVDR